MTQDDERPVSAPCVTGFKDVESETVGGAVDVVLDDAVWQWQRWKARS